MNMSDPIIIEERFRIRSLLEIELWSSDCQAIVLISGPFPHVLFKFSIR